MICHTGKDLCHARGVENIITLYRRVEFFLINRKVSVRKFSFRRSVKIYTQLVEETRERNNGKHQAINVGCRCLHDKVD